MKKISLLLASLVACLFLVAGCGESESTPEKSASDQVNEKAEQRQPYLPQNDVEFKNYNNAQELYDDPNTIIWCTLFPDNPSAPFVTIPVKGKLTSSSTTFFNPEGLVFDVPEDGIGNSVVGPTRSVDGLYHPNPPQYRYGFTPGGQYVDLFNLPTFCTTAPLTFQKESIDLKPDPSLAGADAEAQKALESGDSQKAQDILEAAAGQ